MKKETLDKIVDRLDRLSPRELRQLFSRLSAEKTLLGDILNTLRDGIILFSDNGYASFANKVALRIYGRSLRELRDVPFASLVGDTCSWEEFSQSGVALTRDLQINYPEARHYNFFMSPIGESQSEENSEYLLIIQDDTESRAEGEEQAEAEQMNLLSFLSSGVAHELGNPINSLGLNLQVMQRKIEKLPEEQRGSLQELLSNSLAETKRLDTLIKQFLQSMRPSTLKREHIALNELIHSVLQILEPEIANRDLSLHLNFNEELPDLLADSAQLFQVFYNVIRNAYQSITDQEGGIYIQTSYTDADIVIRISDGGSGISHEMLGNIYEPFRTTKKSGNGLGLLIVRRIIKEHAGSLAIASKKGTGTTVTISLPRADRVTRLLPY